MDLKRTFPMRLPWVGGVVLRSFKSSIVLAPVRSVVRRAVAMRLKVDGHTDEAIGQILGVDLTTLKALLEKDIAGAE